MVFPVFRLLVLLCMCCAAASATPLDLTNYISAMQKKVNQHWRPMPSELAVYLKLSCALRRDGSVSAIRVLNPGNDTANEKLAIAAIRKAAPFAPLPPGSSESVEVEFTLERPPAMTLTVAQAVKKYGPQGRTWLQERCRGAKLAYPPKSLTLIGLKEERLLLVYGDDGNGGSKELAAFPLVSYSGKLGPKLREGDLQIPEGIHKITRMKTNGLLSFELDYPNAVDRRNAAADGRRNLGGDILVHGGSYSTGCLVISNEDMKPLFVAVNDVGIRNTRVIIAPCDLTRRMPNVDMQKQPAWLPTVYASIKHELQKTMIPRAQNRLR